MADVNPPAAENVPTPQTAARTVANADAEIETLDSGGIVESKIGHPDLRKWSRKKARERNRQFLSLASFLLLAVVVLLILVSVALGWKTWDEMSGVTAALLPAVLSLATAALTFYFTKKDKG